MVRAGKHGHCIGGRRSAFYLGSALTPTLQTKGRSFPGNLATLRFPVTGRIGPAFSELLKLSREYQMLTKVTDFRWTRSQRVFNRMEYSQVVRHRFLVPACKGSNPFTPDYEHPIGSVKNELTTGKRLIAVPEPSPGGMHGSLALHGTGVRSPPPSNLTLPRSPYEFELRSPGAKRF
ncbi:hypothetical protein TSUD_335570 [Trifolium subterraneum]|uniref:Uncharacterized protein n=1 Tax=Trifolium subterraneum TaxID=3900 RepID=A0A2Z6LMJ7_TRISU|nr:hypothetical protein TSUD_335570 [Trifolium subterraneum]